MLQHGELVEAVDTHPNHLVFSLLRVLLFRAHHLTFFFRLFFIQSFFLKMVLKILQLVHARNRPVGSFLFNSCGVKTSH
jgi:hypothetical protein